METRNRIWVGLGVVVAASAAFYIGTNSDSDMAGMDHSVMAGMDHSVMAGAEGGGKGGEEGGSTEDAIASDAVYLGQLAFIRGHLNVGVNLYREGLVEAAATHMKHPGDELYADLLPAIEARGAEDFADQLETLALAVENQQPLSDVEQANTNLLEAIAAAESVVTEQDARTLGAVIVDLVRTAAAEFDIATADDGALENEHEYQDSLGFVRIANDLLEVLAGKTDNADAVAAIRVQLETLLPIWPSLQAPQHLATEPSVIYGAASRIETAVLSLQDEI